MTLKTKQMSQLIEPAVLLFAASAAWAQGAEDLRLTVGKSVVIDYPTDIRQISTSNPEIIDASPITTREILLHGKGLGSATMVVWNKSGQRTFYNVSVDLNLDPLRRLLRETYPNEKITVQSSKDSLTLNGAVSSPQIAERVAALAAASSKVVINNLQAAAAPTEKQILLRVKFAELDRNTAGEYGVNLVSTGATNTIGGTTTGRFGPPRLAGIGGGENSFTVSDALNIFAFRPDLGLAGFIKALQTKGLLQILAEPNLVTTNGKEAYFLVGGEFPVPVLQGGANSGAVTIQFREFGIRLTFNPLITENKTIKMYLRQEVSTLDFANSVSLNGFVIPALATRRAETNIELGEGQTFIVAGLVDNREIEGFSKIPVLGSIPIFGSLFKSKTDSKSRSELVLMVTPEITEPLSATDPKPNIHFPSEFLVPLDPAAAKPGETKKKK